MNGQNPVPLTPAPPPQEAQWAAASMLLVVQAIQRLHNAFDGKFIFPKGLS
jgi:hypothetical protein